MKRETVRRKQPGECVKKKRTENGKRKWNAWSEKGKNREELKKNEYVHVPSSSSRLSCPHRITKVPM